jgi:hypothetical protein
MPENVSAFDLSQDVDMAKAYIARRQDDALKLMQSIKTWESYTGNIIRAPLHGHTVLHELRPASLHPQPCWGEMIFKEGSGEEPVIFAHYENFVAFVLARFW